MAAASERLEATVERSSAYHSFAVDDETGKRIGDARTSFLVEGRPRYLQVQLRGLFGHRNRIVPWELATLDEQTRRISLRCRKADVEEAPDFNTKDVLESQARRARTHFGLPAEVHEEAVPDEPTDQLADAAETPQADSDVGSWDRRDEDPSVADELRARTESEDPSVADELRARTESVSGVQRSLPERTHALDDDEKEEEMASESQAAEAVAIRPDSAVELRQDVDQPSRLRRGEREEEDAFRLGTRSSEGWHPTFDVAEVDEGYRVTIDVPGVEADALDLRLEDDVLIVTGERVALAEGDLQRRESPSGPFIRRFRLPAHTNAEAVAAELKNGVLELRIPRSAAPEARRIALRRPEH